jgi:hypothetical protein
MATSSSLKSGTVSNAESSIEIADRLRSGVFVLSICRVIDIRRTLRLISSWGDQIFALSQNRSKRVSTVSWCRCVPAPSYPSATHGPVFDQFLAHT